MITRLATSTWMRLSVLGEQLVLVDGRRDVRRRPCRRVRLLELLVPFRRDEVAQRPPEQLLAAVAESAHERLVDGCQARVEVDGGDQIGGVLEQVAVARLASPERRLDPLPLR